jgi:2'-5' RNA ligase
MVCQPNGAERINLFALVTYIPDPLGKFLDNLRKELVPGCVPHAHVTILPPRPLTSAAWQAEEQIRLATAEMAAFEIDAGDVEVFPVTDVVYIGIRSGGVELREMHGRLNRDHLSYQEPFRYHPHITLGQELPAGKAAEVADLAAQRWREYSGPRRFPVDMLSFVQSTANNLWVDLSNHPLLAQPTLR